MEWIEVFYIHKIIIFEKKELFLFQVFVFLLFCMTNYIVGLGWHNFCFQALIEIKIIFLESECDLLSSKKFRKSCQNWCHSRLSKFQVSLKATLKLYGLILASSCLVYKPRWLHWGDYLLSFAAQILFRYISHLYLYFWIIILFSSISSNWSYVREKYFLKFEELLFWMNDKLLFKTLLGS